MTFLIVTLSFILSTVLSILTLKRSNKIISLFIALSVNTLIILFGHSISEQSEVAKSSGIHTYLLYLILTIPVITWLNYLILMLLASRSLDKT
jgi:hypothetical protein